MDNIHENLTIRGLFQETINMKSEYLMVSICDAEELPMRKRHFAPS